MAQILTKLEAILKDKYQPALTNQINTEPSPFLEKIKKIPLTNNTIKCAAPIGINETKEGRHLITKNLAILVPFNTQELFQQGQSLYYGLNALSNNLRANAVTGNNSYFIRLHNKSSFAHVLTALGVL